MFMFSSNWQRRLFLNRLMKLYGSVYPNRLVTDNYEMKEKIEDFLEFKKPEALYGNNGKKLVETHRIVNNSVLQN